MKKLVTIIFLALLFIQCKDEKVLQQRPNVGFLTFSTTLDQRVRLKAATDVSAYTVAITGVTDASFSREGTVAELSEQPMQLATGSYQVNVASAPPQVPTFSSPIYGATSNFSINGGVTTNVSMVCLQTNAGVKVSYSDNFNSYVQQNNLVYSLSISQAGEVLTYSNNEGRAGYFAPGAITTSLTIGSETYNQVYTIEAQDLMTIIVDIEEQERGHLSIEITGDDAVNERVETMTIRIGDPDTPNPPSDNSGDSALFEDFSSITAGNSTTSTGSNSAWAGNDNFPTVERAYQAGGAIKLGSSSVGGSITSKVLDLSANGGFVRVTLKVKGWSTVEGSIVVTVGDQEETIEYTSVMTDSFEPIEATFANAGATNSQVTITHSTKRGFIDDIQISNE